jgi:hypothetical protein
VIAVVATASKPFSFPVITPSNLFAAIPIASGSAAGIITAATSTLMLSTIRSAGTAKRNGAGEIPIIPASIGNPTLNRSTVIGKASAGETASAACRIL